MIWVAVKIMAPFLGTLNIRCRIMIGIQIRDHNFDNHPYRDCIPEFPDNLQEGRGYTRWCQVSSVHSSGDDTTQGQETLPPASVRSCRAKGGAPSDLPGAKP